MRVLLYTFLLAWCMWFASSCAMLRLNRESTPAEKRAAICQDAAAGYALSVACLNEAFDESEASKYWSTYKLGTESALAVYCKESDDESFLKISGTQ
jgi:hypothetical protein